MADCAVITFPPLVLERDNLLVLALFENFSRHFCSRDERVAVRHVLAISEHQYIAEGCDLTRIDIEKVHIDRVAFRDAKLPASSLNDCVSHIDVLGEGKAGQNSIDGRPWQTENLASIFRSQSNGGFAFERRRRDTFVEHAIGKPAL